MATLLPEGKQAYTDSAGAPLVGGKLYTYDAGTNTPRATYQDAAATTPNTNPVVLDARGEATVFWSGAYKAVLKDASDTTLWTVDNIQSFDTLLASLSTDIFAYYANTADVTKGDAGIGVKRSGAGVVARTQHEVNEDRVVSLADYGGAPGAGDNTAVLASILADYPTGCVIELPEVGEYLMNGVVVGDNYTIRGRGGRGEYDEYCIRPYDLALPALTFGDGIGLTRYCGLVDVHVSGTDGSVGADTQSAKSAPYALLLKGGTVSFTAERSVFYNGVRTVGLVPSATQPVTSNVFINCVIRNDLTDSNNARSIYSLRLADPGYNTSNKLISTKVNGPTLGYAAEIDGTIGGITFEVNDCYWDIKPGKGVLLKGGSQIVCHNFQLDPGTTGAIIIAADSAGDMSRFIVGNMRHGGQKFEFPLGSDSIPAEADTWSYRARHLDAFMSGNIYLNPRERHYDTVVFFDMASPAGPVQLNGSDLTMKSTTQAGSLTSAAISTLGGIASAKDFRCGGVAYVYGGNASAAGDVQANSGGGGLYFEALGANQNIRFVPSGTGVNQMGGTSTQPTGDNTQTNGAAGNRWSVVYAGTGAINTSDERQKQDVEVIPDAWLNAWADVEFTRFKFRDAVVLKGGQARWHIGLIAQRIKSVFEAHGLDAFEIGLLCYDKWGDEYEDKRLEDGGFGDPVLAKPGGDRYGVRYDEALCLEAALMRRELKQLKGKK